MPHRAPHPCNRCRRTLTLKRFCDSCESEIGRAYDQQRGTSSQRGYGARWQQIRERILARDPICRGCRSKPSKHVDHIRPKAHGGADDDANLQGLCASCHSRKTAVSDGRWGGPTHGSG